MSEAGPANPVPKVSLMAIFLAFLTIGGTSFGGAVPYLRDALVKRRGWLTDAEFVEHLSISQALPGLNATNMSILVGQRLGGAPGAVLAIFGMCLPGGILMFIAGILYREHGDRAMTTAALKGVAAAAVALALYTAILLGRKSLRGWADFCFVVVTAIAVALLHQSVLVTLLAVGAVAILWKRPRPHPDQPRKTP